MRWLGLASIASLLLLINSTIADAGCASCGGNDAGSYRTYRGPACFSPPGYCLAPGCCECPPSACDNAWDGYCEEKAKWQAFFSRVGTPRVHCHGCISSVSVETCNTPQTAQPAAETQPKPAAKPDVQQTQPIPTLTPGKATLKSDSRWFR